MRHGTICVFVASATLLVLSVAPLHANAVTYVITDLGTLPGGGLSEALAINNAGQIVGRAYDSAGRQRAFLWDNGTMTDLGTLGGSESIAQDINDFTEITGWADTAGGVERVFRWHAGYMTDLGTLGGAESWGFAISDAGHIVGRADTGSGQEHAFLWLYPGGPMQDIEGLGSSVSEALDINNWTQIVGRATPSGYRAFIWEDGVMSVLSESSPRLTMARGMNDLGQVVCTAGVTAFVWEDGVSTPLGSIPGYAYPEPYDINEHGVIVGWATDGYTFHAFVYDAGVMTDLNTLIPSGTGWTLVQAADINNLGQIVGYGTVGGQTRAFLLKPDSDGDGVPDDEDGCPDDPDKTEPGICGCSVPDTDRDGDDVPDCIDGCPDDPDKIEPGICGCGVPDTDRDGDDVPDCIDGCPDDPDKTEPGICGCGVPDTDSDGDDVPDCIDGCPDDPDKTEPGICGCGVPDVDTDGDEVLDCLDNCPNHANPNQDDCDEDGIGDVCAIATGLSNDCNADGIPDECDIAMTLDQEIVPPGSGTSSMYIGHHPYGGEKEGAQTFTAGRSGTLTTIEIYVRNSSDPIPAGVDLQLDIAGVDANGEPDEFEILGSTTFASDLLPTSTSFVAVDVADLQVEMVAGEQYAIVLRSPLLGTGAYLFAGDSVGGVYDGGTACSRNVSGGWQQGINDNGIRTFVFGMRDDCNGNDVPDECDIDAGTSLDCNANRVPDECEAIGGGDFDADGAISLGDYAALEDCLAGPGLPPAPPEPACVDAYLNAFDFNADDDVDVDDFASFQVVFGGAGE